MSNRLVAAHRKALRDGHEIFAPFADSVTGASVLGGDQNVLRGTSGTAASHPLLNMHGQNGPVSPEFAPLEGENRPSGSKNDERLTAKPAFRPAFTSYREKMNKRARHNLYPVPGSDSSSGIEPRARTELPTLRLV